MGVTIAISGNTKPTPLHANGAPLANVAAGTIHLANTTLKQKLVMPTKVVRRVDDFADVDTSSVSNGEIIRYISANDTFIATNRNVELDGGEY